MLEKNKVNLMKIATILTQVPSQSIKGDADCAIVSASGLHNLGKKIEEIINEELGILNNK